MKSLLLNWKTTAAGLGAILTAGGHLLTSLANGDTNTIAVDLAAIWVGIGLLAAKDGNVTGGTIKQ